MVERLLGKPQCTSRKKAAVPRVTIMAGSIWYPPDIDAGLVDPRESYDPKQCLTYTLGLEMPGIVARTLTTLGFSTKEDEVVVRFERLHDRDINTADIWVTVSPQWSEERMKQQSELVGELVRAVKQFLYQDTSLAMAATLPQIDIELIFLMGGGASVKRGKIVAVW